MVTRPARWRSSKRVTRRYTRVLERLKKPNQLLLLKRGQCPEIACDATRLPPVPVNRVFERQRRQVVHESGFRAQPPQRRREQLRGGILVTDLHNPVASADLVQQEITEGMDNLVAQGFWHQKHSAIDGRSLRGRRHQFHVA